MQLLYKIITITCVTNFSVNNLGSFSVNCQHLQLSLFFSATKSCPADNLSPAVTTL